MQLRGYLKYGGQQMITAETRARVADIRVN